MPKLVCNFEYIVYNMCIFMMQNILNAYIELISKAVTRLFIHCCFYELIFE